MHGVRRCLVETQASRLNLPLWTVDLPWPCSNASYEEIMRGICQRALSEEVTAIAFGDLFLQDVRDYRERQLRDTGLQPLFPLWQIPTRQLALDMIDAGIKSVVTCVDDSKLAASHAGRQYDRKFLQDLPSSADPCGENGEFHTFVYAAPEFTLPIAVETGEVLQRDGFTFADVLPL